MSAVDWLMGQGRLTDRCPALVGDVAGRGDVGV